ncbi:AAA ATPase containing von Willebrand factor type A (vWA) domain [Actinosynnema mirum DSM 43827]|uniref:AAA ATPase containing von Willebrand factor type A (VWA) domain n=1 Tax=Actinosynnema mirum (strain ATCC 29888 / DSM 43827 / JCM 3225 / NBRC 14064 / NCIMB 13271 / NRRL B-12336 / IMRU 3971 / 101) TaxID=446462 RepID=C6WLS0_ACTMD|nr:AAA ATPase containing von Willebrand factor type A (vWA) domain [Actinosynnema mirum DSM 43827]
MLQSTSHGVADSVRPPEFSRAEHARVLTMTAAGSVVLGYAAVAALLALVSSTAAHASFSTTGVLAAAAPGWLAAHHVPLRIGGGDLGVLPLLPTALVMLLVYRAAASAADRLGLFEPLQARSVVLSIAGAHAATGGLIAFLMGDTGPVQATPAVAFFGSAAVSAIAAVAGVAERCGLVEVLFERVDPVVRRGLWGGALALFALTAAGSLLLAAGLALEWPLTSGLFDELGGTVGSGLGIWLLCVGYLPNAVVATVAYLVGAGFSFGSVLVTPLEFVGGPVPAVPLLAAMPDRHSTFLSAVLVLPAVIGVVVGLYLRNAAETPVLRIRAALVAALTAGVGMLVLAAVAGGDLGGGSFSPVTVPAGLAALLVLGWVGVPGALIAWLTGPRPPRVKKEKVKRGVGGEVAAATAAGAAGVAVAAGEDDGEDGDEVDEDGLDDEYDEAGYEDEYDEDAEYLDEELADDELLDDELSEDELADEELSEEELAAELAEDERAEELAERELDDEYPDDDSDADPDDELADDYDDELDELEDDSDDDGAVTDELSEDELSEDELAEAERTADDLAGADLADEVPEAPAGSTRYEEVDESEFSHLAEFRELAELDEDLPDDPAGPGPAHRR